MSRDVDELEETGVTKYIPLIVMLGAVGGFIALAWYAYHAGRQSMREEDLLVIEAEKTPVKEKPLDPGGMKFPNQDKTVFETFSTTQQQAKVERVLPSPEEPLSKEEAIDAMVSKRTDKVVLPVKEERITFDDITPAVTMKTPEVKIAEPEPVKQEKIADAIAAENPAPKMVEKTVEKKEGKKAEEKPLRKLFPVKVQLGAFGSEKEAQDNWKKMQAKFAALSGRSPLLVQADVKGKTFYRLRVGVADKDEAKKLCSGLSSKGQACIIASE